MTETLTHAGALLSARPRITHALTRAPLRTRNFSHSLYSLWPFPPTEGQRVPVQTKDSTYLRVLTTARVRACVGVVPTHG